MASFGFLVRVYGEVNEAPPYATTAGGNLPAVSATYDSLTAKEVSFPTQTPNVYPISGYGSVMNGGTSCYSIVEIPASGLNQLPKRYVVQQTVTQVNTLRNA